MPLLSEWGRPMWCLLRPDGSGASIGAELELENMEENSVLGEVKAYGDDENVWSASIALAKEAIGAERSGLRIGVERDLLTLHVAEALEASFPGSELVDVGPAAFEARLIKSDEEVALLRLGGQLAKIGASAFMEAQHAGATEIEVATHAVAAVERALGALAPNLLSSTYAYCQTGVRSLTPHLHPTGHRLVLGEVVALNVFPVLSGYCMELERTYVLGGAGGRQAEVLDVVGRSFDLGKEAIRPGVPMRDIDALCRGVLEEAGLGGYVRHGTGHAHGIMVGNAGREDMGELRSYNARQLEPNMVCSVEPGVYIPELGGFRHSDVMLVTEDGGECLTTFPRDLAALNLGD